MRSAATAWGALDGPVGPPFVLDIEGDCVRCAGELDMATAPQLQRAVRRLAGQGCSAIAVDLTGIEFMDCAGLRGLVALRAQAERGRWTLVFTGMSPAVERVVALTGSDQQLA